MKIYIFGSCAGTEPMENRHHTSMAIEVEGQIYWFDAGDNCSYTAHLMGVDLLSVCNIFISHPHMDHVGGLADLLWNIRKLTYMKDMSPRFGDIVTLYMPNEKTFDGVMTILENSELDFCSTFKVQQKRITESLIHKDENISVEAIHNNHMPISDEGWVSYSFSIMAEGKKIVYSGDIKGLDDIESFIKDGCDVLFLETGHHSAEVLCSEIVQKGYDVKHIYFSHHGRAILADYEGELEKCRKVFPDVTFCNDKDVFCI